MKIYVAQGTSDDPPDEELLYHDAAADVDDYNADTEYDLDGNSLGSNDDEELMKKPLYEGCKISLGSTIVIIMALVLRHQLSWAAVDDLLTLLNLLLPVTSLLLRTRHTFEKLFRCAKNVIDLHYYCPHCYSCVSNNDMQQCTECGNEIKVDLKKSGNFFYTFTIG